MSADIEGRVPCSICGYIYLYGHAENCIHYFENVPNVPLVFSVPAQIAASTVATSSTIDAFQKRISALEVRNNEIYERYSIKSNEALENLKDAIEDLKSKII